MIDKVMELWPELEWIGDEDLRRKSADTWALALLQSALTIQDLDEIPFTLLVKDCPVTFMEHKRSVVHIAYASAKTMQKFFGGNLPVDLDVVVAGRAAGHDQPRRGLDLRGQSDVLRSWRTQSSQVT